MTFIREPTHTCTVPRDSMGCVWPRGDKAWVVRIKFGKERKIKLSYDETKRSKKNKHLTLEKKINHVSQMNKETH